MMMRIKIFITFLIISSSFISFGQKKQLISIAPGTSKTVTATNEKLYVITKTQLQNTIVTGMMLDTCKKQNEIYKQLVDTLKEISVQKDILIDTLTNDRDFYIKSGKECETDVETLLKMNESQYNKTKWAIIIGSSTTVVAFVVGFILGIK